MKVEILTDFVERLDVGRRLLLDGDWVTVKAARIHKERLLLTLSTVHSIEDAQALYGHYLESITDERPELDEDEFVTGDLIGLEVFTIEGERLGNIDEVMPMPAHDVIRVGDILIPAVKEFVKKVDLEKQRVDVELIEGMRGELD